MTLTFFSVAEDKRESAESAYGADANKRDTACAIKSEIYNNINIIIYNIFTAYITDTKVEQAEKRDQKF